MFDQIREDNWREFYLMLGMQEPHKELRRNQNLSSYRQTQSQKVYGLFVCLYACLFLLAMLSLIFPYSKRNSFLIYKSHSYKSFHFFSHTNLLSNLFFALCCFNRKCSLFLFIFLVVRKPVSPVYSSNFFVYFIYL